MKKDFIYIDDTLYFEHQRDDGRCSRRREQKED